MSRAYVCMAHSHSQTCRATSHCMQKMNRAHMCSRICSSVCSCEFAVSHSEEQVTSEALEGGELSGGFELFDSTILGEFAYSCPTWERDAVVYTLKCWRIPFAMLTSPACCRACGLRPGTHRVRSTYFNLESQGCPPRCPVWHRLRRGAGGRQLYGHYFWGTVVWEVADTEICTNLTYTIANATNSHYQCTWSLSLAFDPDPCTCFDDTLRGHTFPLFVCRA